jgi:hypothetical protein
MADEVALVLQRGRPLIEGWQARTDRPQAGADSSSKSPSTKGQVAGVASVGNCGFGVLVTENRNVIDGSLLDRWSTLSTNTAAQ